MATEAEVERLVVRLVGDASKYATTLDEAVAMAQRAAAQIQAQAQVQATANQAVAEAQRVEAAAIADAARVKQSVLSPTERYTAELTRLGGHLKEGRITQDEYSRSLDLLKSRMGETGQAASSMGQQILGGAQMLAGVIMTRITRPIQQLARASLGMAATIQGAATSFRTMLRSGERAGAFLEDLKDFAATTPFEFVDLVTSAKRMMALGFQAEEVIPLLRTLGDAAAGLGGGAFMIQRLGLALGQMRAKGKVSGEEMRQLAESGIPAWEFLAAKIGVSIPEAMKLAEKGAIEVGTAIPAIMEGMNQRFGGLMDEFSQTAMGRFSNVKDALGFVLGDIGQSLMPLANMFLERFALPALEALKGLVSWFAKLPEPVKMATIFVAGLAASLGPVLIGLGSFRILAAQIKPAFLAIGFSLKWLAAEFIVFGFSAAASWALATAGITVLITGIALVALWLGKLASEEGKVTEEANKMSKVNQDVKKAMDEASASVKSQSSKVSDLKESAASAAKEAEELAKKQEKLATNIESATKTLERQILTFGRSKAEATGIERRADIEELIRARGDMGEAVSEAEKRLAEAEKSLRSTRAAVSEQRGRGASLVEAKLLVEERERELSITRQSLDELKKRRADARYMAIFFGQREELERKLAENLRVVAEREEEILKAADKLAVAQGDLKVAQDARTAASYVTLKAAEAEVATRREELSIAQEAAEAYKKETKEVERKLQFQTDMNVKRQEELDALEDWKKLQEEATKAIEDADKEVERMQKDVGSVLGSMMDKLLMFGASAKDIELKKLMDLGATPEELEKAASMLDTLEFFKEQEENAKAAKKAIDEYRTPYEKLGDKMAELERLKGIGAFKDAPKAYKVAVQSINDELMKLGKIDYKGLEAGTMEDVAQISEQIASIQSMREGMKEARPRLPRTPMEIEASAAEEEANRRLEIAKAEEAARGVRDIEASARLAGRGLAEPFHVAGEPISVPPVDVESVAETARGVEALAVGAERGAGVVGDVVDGMIGEWHRMGSLLGESEEMGPDVLRPLGPTPLMIGETEEQTDILKEIARNTNQRRNGNVVLAEAVI